MPITLAIGRLRQDSGLPRLHNKTVSKKVRHQCRRSPCFLHPGVAQPATHTHTELQVYSWICQVPLDVSRGKLDLCDFLLAPGSFEAKGFGRGRSPKDTDHDGQSSRQDSKLYPPRSKANQDKLQQKDPLFWEGKDRNKCSTLNPLIRRGAISRSPLQPSLASGSFSHFYFLPCAPSYPCSSYQSHMSTSAKPILRTAFSLRLWDSIYRYLLKIYK